ncbi:MAG TPA: hypothetical protein VF042_05210, partial [Gemmatimonadaceae bacterium]
FCFGSGGFKRIWRIDPPRQTDAVAGTTVFLFWFSRSSGFWFLPKKQLLPRASGENQGPIRQIRSIRLMGRISVRSIHFDKIFEVNRILAKINGADTSSERHISRRPTVWSF